MSKTMKGFVIAQVALLALMVLVSACSPGGPTALAKRRGKPKPTATATVTSTATATATVTSAPTATASPTAIPTTAPTATPTTPPSSTGMLPPGSPLPSEATCASRVKRSSWEPRTDNTTANMRVPTASQVANVGPWGPDMGLDAKADTLRQQMTGNFTGTTDEILQWVACKWGIDPDIVRAEAVVESWWHQSQRGDYTTNQQYCPPGTWTGSGCYQSYGILQIKWYYFQDAWPMARDNTAFSAEYVYGMLRACYEGWTTYLNDGTPMPGYPAYHAGDIWGCLGRWYSGWWYTQDAVNYIAEVKSEMANKTWLSANFAGG